MSLLERHEHGWIVPVRATAGARRNEVRGEQDGALKICVTQVPEKGKANLALRDQLAQALGVRKSQVELVTGATSSRKKFLVRDVPREELEASLARLRGAN